MLFNDELPSYPLWSMWLVGQSRSLHVLFLKKSAYWRDSDQYLDPGKK